MQTIFDRITSTYREKFKKQGDLAAALKIRQNILSTYITNQSEPNFIPKLRNFVIDNKISPEDLYYIITGVKVDSSKAYSTIMSELNTYKSIAENLSETLSNITQTKKKTKTRECVDG